MSRAAILPFPGDPFLLHYWLKFFWDIWQHEVDRLYIHFNSPIEKEVVDYIFSLCPKDEIELIYLPRQIEHGDAINNTLDFVKEDLIMLIEDDGFIFIPSWVNGCFELIEDDKYDIVGSKRLSCSMEIANAAAAKWGLSYEGLGDQGCNFWPCFFFTKKELLLKTDRRFGARAWKRGEIVEPLGLTIQKEEVAATDTFVNTSLQLRNLVPEDRIQYVPQYHAHPDDLIHFEQKQWIFDGKAPWCHIGSLSSGVGGVLMDNEGRSLSRRLLDPPQGPTRIPGTCDSEMEHKEWERRVQMWLTFYEASEPDKILEFRELYRQAIYRIIQQFGLNIKRIRARQEAYRTLDL